uniref:Uncharacterized protein n=1 Tax=Paramormyrops kingsleyae TaxID=1676925 RepID=A0A3B3QKA9_9TELE
MQRPLLCPPLGQVKPARGQAKAALTLMKAAADLSQTAPEQAVTAGSDESSDSSDENKESDTASDDSDDDDDTNESDSDETTEVTSVAPTPPVWTMPPFSDNGRGDSLGYPSDYKSIMFMESNKVEKGPSSYKSYGADKMDDNSNLVNKKSSVYTEKDRNDIEKTLKVYKVSAHFYSACSYIPDSFCISLSICKADITVGGAVERLYILDFHPHRQSRFMRTPLRRTPAPQRWSPRVSTPPVSVRARRLARGRRALTRRTPAATAPVPPMALRAARAAKKLRPHPGPQTPTPRRAPRARRATPLRTTARHLKSSLPNNHPPIPTAPNPVPPGAINSEEHECTHSATWGPSTCMSPPLENNTDAVTKVAL